MIRVLFIGDVFGQPGRRAIKQLVPGLRRELGPHLVVANGENASGGLGLNAKGAEELFVAGVDVITGGNHTWKHRDLAPLLEQEPHLLRPHNYPDAPGRGWVLARARDAARTTVAVVNLEGRVFMSDLECPFRAMDKLLAGPLAGAPLVVVDMHAEATSEKLALAKHLDGRVAAVVGTHTHVPTADARVLPGGTAYITDLGLTGPCEGVIGVDPRTAIERFVTQRPFRFQVAKGPARLQGVLLDLDPATGRAAAIERVDRPLP